jgi:hypothetical protein
LRDFEIGGAAVRLHGDLTVARELADQAAQEPYEDRHRYMLHPAATYQRATDQMAPPPPPAPLTEIFRNTMRSPTPLE